MTVYLEHQANDSVFRGSKVMIYIGFNDTDYTCLDCTLFDNRSTPIWSPTTSPGRDITNPIRSYV